MLPIAARRLPRRAACAAALGAASLLALGCAASQQGSAGRPRPVLWVVAELDVAASPSFVHYLAHSSVTAGEYVIRIGVRGAERSKADIVEQVRVTVPPPGPAVEAPPGAPIVLRSGPFTGKAFQPTGDARIRRGECLRVDVAVAGPAPTVSARLLDRKGQALPVPVEAADRQQTYLCIASAELALAPLAVGDCLGRTGAATSLAERQGSRHRPYRAVASANKCPFQGAPGNPADLGALHGTRRQLTSSPTP